MPHRLYDLTLFMSHCLEAAFLGLALGWNSTAYFLSIISDSDWSRMTGPHGVAFLAVAAVVVLWLNKMASDKSKAKELKEAEARSEARREEDEANKEKRHLESRTDMHRFAEDLKGLTADSIKAQLLTNASLSANNLKVAELVLSVDRMTSLLAVSPCLVSHQLRVAALSHPTPIKPEEPKHHAES